MLCGFINVILCETIGFYTQQIALIQAAPEDWAEEPSSLETERWWLQLPKKAYLELSNLNCLRKKPTFSGSISGVIPEPKLQM